MIYNERPETQIVKQIAVVWCSLRFRPTKWRREKKKSECRWRVQTEATHTGHTPNTRAQAEERPAPVTDQEHGGDGRQAAHWQEGSLAAQLSPGFVLISRDRQNQRKHWWRAQFVGNETDLSHPKYASGQHSALPHLEDSPTSSWWEHGTQDFKDTSKRDRQFPRPLCTAEEVLLLLFVLGIFQATSRKQNITKVLFTWQDSIWNRLRKRPHSSEGSSRSVSTHPRLRDTVTSTTRIF